MPDQPEASLVVRSGISGVERVALNKSRHVLGRREPADIVLDNEYVSGSHAEITFTDNQYAVRDLDSKNGTFLDSAPVGDRPVPLISGARIDLGHAAVVLTFQLADATTTQTSSDFGLETNSSETSWLEVRPQARAVLVGGKVIDTPLSPKAFDLLSLLFTQAGTACSWADISRQVWPERDGAPVSPGEVAQQVRQIRHRIDPEGTRPNSISSVQGFGYRLDL